MSDFLAQVLSWLPSLLVGLKFTLLLTGTSMALALALAIPIALVRTSKRLPVLRVAVTFVVEVLRGTPLLLQLFYVYFVLPQFGIQLEPLVAATIALGVNYSAYLSEVFRGGIAAIDKSQWEAAAALNLSPRVTWTHVILPQALRISIPATGNYVISMFKDTALAATVSVTELLFSGQIIAQQTFQYLQIYSIVFVLYLVVTLPAGRALSWFERRMQLETRP